jgi:hypothetical protein
LNKKAGNGLEVKPAKLISRQACKGRLFHRVYCLKGAVVMKRSILLVVIFTVLLSGCQHAVSDRAGLLSTTPSHVVSTAILPAPTATATLSATPTLPIPTPTITRTSTPTFTPTPTPHPMSILAMRAGIYSGSDIVIEKELTILRSLSKIN